MAFKTSKSIDKCPPARSRLIIRHPKKFDEVLKCLSLIGGISLNYHHLLEIPSLVPSTPVYVTHDYVTPVLDLMPSFGLPGYPKHK